MADCRCFSHVVNADQQLLQQLAGETADEAIALRADKMNNRAIMSDHYHAATLPSRQGITAS